MWREFLKRVIQHANAEKSKCKSLSTIEKLFIAHPLFFAKVDEKGRKSLYSARGLGKR